MVRLQAKLFAALLALVVAGAPLAVFAQAADDQETIHGQIATFDGGDNLQLNDDRGFLDNVQLGGDTVVHPNGTRLQPGMTVTIVGVNRGSVLAANQIDVAAGATAPAAPQSGYVPPRQPARRTALTGILETALDSKSAYVGEDVTLTSVSSADGSFGGATMHGTVADVTPPGQGRNAQIKLHFDSLRLVNGTTSPIDGIVTSMDVKTKNNAAKEAGGALIGMLAGNALVKTILGISGGGLIGAVGGFLIAKDNRTDVVIPANTAITVRLLNPRRQAS